METINEAETPSPEYLDDISHTFGVNECQESEGKSEDHLRKLYQTCAKSPGHTQFIPIKEFTQQHLPPRHRSIDLYRLIKATADQTVRISVDMVSPSRPEFWPKTKVPYPFYNDGGNANLRSGTGQIEVFRYIDGCGYSPSGSRYSPVGGGTWEEVYGVDYKTCPCEQCQHSDKPNNVWFQLYVNTAAHVVFDDIEAKHTSCRLFFDDHNSPKINLDNVSVFDVDIERDRCWLQYMTCDITLGDKLYKNAARWADLWDKVDNKYKLRFTDKFNFIVSHPHGCPKQVSVGQWVDNTKVSKFSPDFNLTKLTYTTSTCPGSSGARVYCMGLGTGHVHNGALDSGLNYSSLDAYFNK